MKALNENIMTKRRSEEEIYEFPGKIGVAWDGNMKRKKNCIQQHASSEREEREANCWH